MRTAATALIAVMMSFGSAWAQPQAETEAKPPTGAETEMNGVGDTPAGQDQRIRVTGQTSTVGQSDTPPMDQGHAMDQSQMRGKEAMGGMCPCQRGMRAMGWLGMALGGLLVLSAIAALVALAVFLVRRSRARPVV